MNTVARYALTAIREGRISMDLSHEEFLILFRALRFMQAMSPESKDRELQNGLLDTFYRTDAEIRSQRWDLREAKEYKA